jgi:hypothetical protein
VLEPALERSGRRRRRAYEGIQVRHKTRCSSRGGGGCSCSPSYQAQVWSVRDRKPIRRTFGSLAEARAWRQESQVAVRRLTMRTPSSVTVGEAAGAPGRGVFRLGQSHDYRAGGCWRGCCSRGSELSVHACRSQRQISGLVGGGRSRGSRFGTGGVVRVRVGVSVPVLRRIRRRCGLLVIGSRSGGLLARWLRRGRGGRSRRSRCAG